MTLLTICQDAADDIKITRPQTIVGNTSTEAQSLLRAAQKVGKRLMSAYAWQILRGEQTFTSVATETQTAILPSDFDRIIPETLWDRTDMVLISGPISATEWQGKKAHQYSDTRNPKFILRGGIIAVQPTLSAGHTLAFEYVSNLWCQSAALAGQTRWAADTDTAKIDEELITLGVTFEYLDSDGLPSAKAAAAYQERYKLLVKNDQPTAGIMVSGDIFGGGRHFTGEPPVSSGDLE